MRPRAAIRAVEAASHVPEMVGARVACRYPDCLRIGMGSRILVVGDVMLDHYWDGAVDRISPEAPVPVLRVTGERFAAGGAANVAVNLAALGAEVTLLAPLGCDDAAAELARLVTQQGVAMECVADDGYRTTRKVRFVSRRQQLLRADIEQEPPPSLITLLMQRFEAVLPQYDMLLLSDYAKGALQECRPFVRLARERGMPVLVDPKGANWQRYAGATVLKPNLIELQRCCGAFSGEQAMCNKAIQLRKRLQVDHLLVTRGDEGMSLFSSERVRHLPARVREVYDVSGAGDTVLATLAFKMVQGSNVEEAMSWAAAAAGVVVGKFGTSTLSRLELEEAMHD
jgi:rfaE bifunctional protein kinase chain/domain